MPARQAARAAGLPPVPINDLQFYLNSRRRCRTGKDLRRTAGLTDLPTSINTVLKLSPAKCRGALRPWRGSIAFASGPARLANLDGRASSSTSPSTASPLGSSSAAGGQDSRSSSQAPVRRLDCNSSPLRGRKKRPHHVSPEAVSTQIDNGLTLGCALTARFDARRWKGIAMIGRSISAAVLMTFLLVSTVSAEGGCYGPPDGVNSGAWVEYGGTDVAKGVNSRLDHYDKYVGYSDTIVHPVQISMTKSVDFVGWGTVKGKGTTGGTEPHLSDCPDNYSAGWHVYADGVQYDQYWCRAGYADVGGNAKDVDLKIRYGTCPTTGLPRFVLYLDGVANTCALTDYSYGTVAVGGESVYADPPVMEIDIDHENLQVYFTSGWYYWSASAVNTECDSETFGADPYLVTRLSATKYRITDGDFNP